MSDSDNIPENVEPEEFYEDDDELDENKPEEKMGISFYIAIVIIISLAILVMFLVPALKNTASTEMTSRTWILDAYADPTGTLQTVNLVDRITIQFGQNGIIQGFSGCSLFTGTYVVDSTAVTITGLNATRRACPDTLSTQREMAYFEDLLNVSSVRTGNQTLLFYDARGNATLKFRG